MWFAIRSYKLGKSVSKPLPLKIAFYVYNRLIDDGVNRSESESFCKSYFLDKELVDVEFLLRSNTLVEKLKYEDLIDSKNRIWRNNGSGYSCNHPDATPVDSVRFRRLTEKVYKTLHPSIISKNSSTWNFE
jgi:hypothetical protein